MAHLLSTREWEVLDLQAEGFGYKEIGSKLAIAESTVKNHLTKVREKVGARNGIEAINKAYLRPPD
jgi:two-component system nitrate/nitrite response regulator NarL